MNSQVKGEVSHRFLADSMVGRLAKWLRILGHDVILYKRIAKNSKISSDEIIRIARTEKRLILTRDAHLLKRKNLPPHVFILHDRIEDQLRQVTRDLNLKPEATFSRCLDCNSALEEIGKETVKGRIPAYVYQTQNTFHICPICQKIFWEGTHVGRMIDRLKHFELRG